MKNLVRRLARAAVRRIGEFLREDPQPSGPVNFEHDDFAYPWLNAVFLKILKEESRCRRKPAYVWGVLHSAHQAKALKVDRISVIEFGVAGGNGLVALEAAAARIEQELGVAIEVFGFDTGSGLPKPQDYRDLPNLWVKGAYPMDEEALRGRLRSARLMLGHVRDTVPRFIDSKPAPVGFISFDLDYYSSTKLAFELLESDPALVLPRVHCYFDDIMGFSYSDFTGERLAIREFNEDHDRRKISRIYGLEHYVPERVARDMWTQQIYLAHIFDHELYCHHDGLVKRYFSSATDLAPPMAIIGASLRQFVPEGVEKFIGAA